MPYRVKVNYADPLHSGRHPFQVYMLTLCVFAGIPLAVGRGASAASIEALLPPWMVVAWGLSLVIGSLVALIGARWPATDPANPAKRGKYRMGYATALTLEKIGLVTVGPAAIVYAAAIWLFAVTTGPFSATSLTRGSVAALIIVGFGAACLRRARDLSRVLEAALKVKEHNDASREAL